MTLFEFCCYTLAETMEFRLQLVYWLLALQGGC